MIDQKALSQITRVEKSCKECSKKKGLDGKTLTKLCKHCPVGQELQELGAQLERSKIDQRMAKGRNMTFSDVLSCLESGVDPKEIKKVTHMSHGHTFQKYMNNHGYDVNGNIIGKRQIGGIL